MSLDASMFLSILPEILLLVLGILILALDLALPKGRHRSLGWVAAVGMWLIILVSLPAHPIEAYTSFWGGMISYDWMSFTFKMLFIFAASLTVLLGMNFKELGSRGEFYVLIIASTIGMAFMACAADLVMLYLAIETTSIPLYILAGFFGQEDSSTEAGFKYLLFGALTSTVMLYGFSLLYGVTGTTSLIQIQRVLGSNQVGLLPIVGSMLLILLGFGFKVSLVPLHFWAPDVYQGAPTPVAGFLSTASKAAGFAALVRVLLIALPFPVLQWNVVLAALSVATMTLGNLIALSQTNIKRMLAYSSIAHAGYALIGIVAINGYGSFNQLALTSLIFYLIAYVVTNLAAFGVVTIFGRLAGSDEFPAYYGLSRRSPVLALVLLVALLSLAGMPPLGGFVAKVFVFAAAVKAGLIWLAVVGVLNSIIGLYYYLTVLKYVYLYRSEEDESPIQLDGSYKLALGVLSFGIILVGTAFGPWFHWASMAAATIFP
jgi:NADH-quinone oxidoreductase subunit N